MLIDIDFNIPEKVNTDRYKLLLYCILVYFIYVRKIYILIIQ